MRGQHIGQSYDRLEVILVDDGSPDGCPDICDAYARQDARVRVLHKRNGGLSDARNAGIALATGEYLTFVDSDDFIEKDMIRNLMEAIEADGAEIAFCKNSEYKDGVTVLPPYNKSRRKMTVEEMLRITMLGKGGSITAWGKDLQGVFIC